MQIFRLNLFKKFNLTTYICKKKFIPIYALELHQGQEFKHMLKLKKIKFLQNWYVFESICKNNFENTNFSRKIYRKNLTQRHTFVKKVSSYLRFVTALESGIESYVKTKKKKKFYKIGTYLNPYAKIILKMHIFRLNLLKNYTLQHTFVKKISSY